ncbi:hypothetical protein PM082_006432 [Marasmius tenuissimus]|nr:hypothetical protein PM082_006432 [Marasmius tenuissimus]
MGNTTQAWGLFRLSSHLKRALERCLRCAKHESARSNNYMLTAKRIYLELIKHKTGGYAANHRADVERWYPDPEPVSSSGIQLPTPPFTSPASLQGMSIASSSSRCTAVEEPFATPGLSTSINLTLSPDGSSQFACKRKAPTRSDSPVPKGKGKEKQRRTNDGEPLEGREDDYIAVTVALTEELIESPGDISRNLEEVLIDLRYQLLTCKRF